ncbi:MAG: hypothetical protein ACTSYI_17605 [Promethearchaeota archaeon]
MFEEERKEFEIFFDFYQKKFKEEVGLLPGVYEDDDFEIDLVMGQDSEEFLGARIMQYVPVDESTLEEGDRIDEIDELDDLKEDKEEGSENKTEEKDGDVYDEDEEDDDEYDDDEYDDDDEDELMEMILYDFVKSSEEKPTIEGQPYFQIVLNAPAENDDEEEGSEKEEADSESDKDAEKEPELKLLIYAQPIDESYEGDFQDLPGEKVELTGAVMIEGNDVSTKVVFLADPDFV